MFRNYFKISWRNLVKNRLFTMLNLVGLSTGIACSLLIYLWVSDELRVDKYNEKDDRLYQVMANTKTDAGIKTMDYTPGLLAKALSEELPEIEYAVSVLPATWFSNKGVISFGDKHLKAGGEYVGKDYFNVFTCHFNKGNGDQLFADNYSVAVSEELAMKLFGTTQNIIGKTVKWELHEFGGSFSVSGIFEKNPTQATAQFDLLFNYNLVLERRPNLLNFGNSDPSTYLIVKEGIDIDRLNTKIRGFLKSKSKESKSDLFLTRYSDKYLHGKYENGVQAGGRIAYVKLFSIIAVFILIIACINFMNLSTAKAARRLKEVGVKKVMGASRSMLIFQYLGESLLMTFLSLILATALIILMLPVFNEITGKQLALQYDTKLILIILAITLLTGIVAGSYPALYLSGFKPSAVLKGKLNTSLGELWVRKVLVTFQFTLSVIFIAAVMIVYRQVDFIQSKNLGYQRDNIIHFEIPLDMDENKLRAASTFLDEIKNIPGVVNASSYYHNLTGDHGGIGGFQWPGKAPGTDIDFANLEVGYGFIETIGIELIEGRNFSNNPNAQKEIIFNETAIKSMGLKNPVGKTVRFWDQERVIVGVVKDFHFESLYENVKPCFFQVFPIMPNILVKIKNGTERQTIKKIQTAFTAFNKGLAFDYKFLDEDYQALYASEKRVGILSRYFAGLALIISCLGLFGLAAFTAQRRQKEIGIRKVVGASARSVAFLLSKEFLKLVLIAITIAFPLVWWTMNSWLNDFAYRIDITPDIFLITALSAMIITIITVSFQSIKAAMVNPAKSLRTE